MTPPSEEELAHLYDFERDCTRARLAVRRQPNDEVRLALLADATMRYDLYAHAIDPAYPCEATEDQNRHLDALSQMVADLVAHLAAFSFDRRAYRLLSLARYALARYARELGVDVEVY